MDVRSEVCVNDTFLAFDIKKRQIHGWAHLKQIQNLSKRFILVSFIFAQKKNTATKYTFPNRNSFDLSIVFNCVARNVQ